MITITTFRRFTRALAAARRVEPIHYHGGVLGPVSMCDDPRCTRSGRGSLGPET
ncbi:MAG TPA: hypothetical protein VFR97_01060 [Capillimicrobium sp.]|nr:hypothetical protein [Capillimicrobium sp.]